MSVKAATSETLRYIGAILLVFGLVGIVFSSGIFIAPYLYKAWLFLGPMTLSLLAAAVGLGLFHAGQWVMPFSEYKKSRAPKR